MAMSGLRGWIIFAWIALRRSIFSEPATLMPVC
jgi:hypothetical protein